MEINEIKVKEIDSKIVSNCCIWCRCKEGLSESHIFPKCFGARIRPYLSCKSCNSFFGHEIEGELKKNYFFATGLVKTELQDKKNAYRHFENTDVEEGLRVKYLENAVSPIIKKSSDGTMFGPPSELRKIDLKKFKSIRPNWPIKPLEEFYDDPTRSNFKYAGLVFTQKEIPQKLTTVKQSGGTKEIDPRFIFKVVYEFMGANDFLKHEKLQSILGGAFTVNIKEDKHRINFSERLAGRVLSNLEIKFRDVKQLDTLDYKPYHYITIHLSKELIIYCEIMFFGLINVMFIIDRYCDDYEFFIPIFDKTFVHHINPSDMWLEDYPNLKRKMHCMCTDAAVQARVWELENANIWNLQTNSGHDSNK